MYVIDAGMTTCVGSRDADASCAAFRCRVSGFAELPYKDLRNTPVVGAPVRHISHPNARADNG